MEIKKAKISETERTLQKAISYAEMGDDSALIDSVILCEQLQREGMQELISGSSEESTVLYDDHNFVMAHEYIKTVRRLANEMIKSGRYNSERCERAYFECLRFDAPFDFDAFMLYIEKDRAKEKQYWLPRRGKLLHIAKALQSMEDDELDELFLAMPPRTGKTTLIMFFMVWVMCRHPDKSNLYCSYTQSVVDAFFSGVLEILNDPITYKWKEVFPSVKVAGTNAKDLLINLNRKKRYATFTGRSLYGTLNGACDCNGYEVADDLVSGIEEAMSKDRLDGCWLKVDNNYLPRAKEGSKRLWIGTRWAQADPQARRSALLEQDARFKNIRWEFINTPALTEDGCSNFEYLYGVGFSSEFYQQRRASFERNGNMADWFAQYQGQPIDRVGAVFEPSDLRYFNGELPDGEADRIFMAVDPAWGGGDYVASPVIAQYGEDMYVVDVVYDNGDKTKTWANIKEKVIRHGVQAIMVEATRATSAYSEGLNEKLRAEGIRINVQSSVKNWAGGIGKEQRIFDKAPDIRECMIFIDSDLRTKEYQKFMENVYAFKIGMNKHEHDDAPDSLAQAITMAFGFRHRARILSRSALGL